MAKSNLVTLGVVLGTVGFLMIGGAFLAFSEASESFDESVENSEAGCELHYVGFCWFNPGGTFGCGFCLLGIFLVGLVVPIGFGGFLRSRCSELFSKKSIPHSPSGQTNMWKTFLY